MRFVAAAAAVILLVAAIELALTFVAGADASRSDGNETAVDVEVSSVYLWLGGMDGRTKRAHLGVEGIFSGPSACAVEPATGDLFVTDLHHHVVRRVTPAGDMVTWAGTIRTPGSTDGIGTSASFHMPANIVIDSDGANLYVSDAVNHILRKIEMATIEVSLFAGRAGTNGATDGTGTAARFSGPFGLTFDLSGNLFVCDFGNDRIRKVTTPGAVVTTFAGSATGFSDARGHAARFFDPIYVTFDSSASNLYITEVRNERIRKATVPGAVVSTLAGDGVEETRDGIGTAARFHHPAGIVIDPSKTVLFVADRDSHQIRKIVIASRRVVTVIGTGNGGWSSNANPRIAEVYEPFNFCINATLRTLYILGAHAISTADLMIVKQSTVVEEQPTAMIDVNEL